MNNFIFKSPRRLTKNSPITIEILINKLDLIQMELRHQRQDNDDIKRMLNKVLINDHLQHQVDNYFENQSGPPPNEDQEPD